MRLVKLKIGDDVWCHSTRTSGDEKNNPLVKGKVVHIFELEQKSTQYVVEFPSPVDSILEVYDQFSVSDDPNQPIGLWRR
jgi:hypothetical protein